MTNLLVSDSSFSIALMNFIFSVVMRCQHVVCDALMQWKKPNKLAGEVIWTPNTSHFTMYNNSSKVLEAPAEPESR
jgi:hypothetical protein